MGVGDVTQGVQSPQCLAVPQVGTVQRRRKVQVGSCQGPFRHLPLVRLNQAPDRGIALDMLQDGLGRHQREVLMSRVAIWG